MARPESLANAGFIPMPLELVPFIGHVVQIDDYDAATNIDPRARRCAAIMDPCAGEGDAVFELASALYGGSITGAQIKFYLVELEPGRAKKVEARLREAKLDSRATSKVICGDAMCLEYAKANRCAGVSLLYMNPPYSDRDPDFHRLEARWLSRHYDALCNQGVLVLVIPTSAIGSCAEMLAKHFDTVQCYRFPSPMFDAYKQVVIVAVRGTSMPTPRPNVFAWVCGWATNPASIPELPLKALRSRIPVPTFREIDDLYHSGHRAGFSDFSVTRMDVHAVARSATPWRIRDRRGNEFVIGGLLPESGGAALREPRIESVMPLHAGHITSALALDLYNGVALEPNDRSSGLPKVLLKAVFRREWLTVERKTNEKNELVGERQRERPKINITVLDLEAGQVHRLRSSVERTDEQAIGRMTVADFLAHYGDAMVRVVRERCPALYDPSRDGVLPEFKDLDEPLYKFQRSIVCANIRLIEQQGTGLILGQTGSGKTRVSLALMRSLGSKRALVFCPPHLRNDPWEKEARAAWRGLRVIQIEDVDDVDRFARDPSSEPILGVLAATAGKLGHGWVGVGSTADEAAARHVKTSWDSTSDEVLRHRAAFVAPKPETKLKSDLSLRKPRCPECGAEIEASPEALARARHKGGAGYCKAQRWVPHRRHERLGRFALELIELLLPAFPEDEHIKTWGTPTYGHRRLEQAWGTARNGSVDAEKARRERAWLNIQGRIKELTWLLSEPLRQGSQFAYEGAIGRLVVATQADELAAAIAQAIYEQAAKYAERDLERVSHAELARMRESARRLLLAMHPGSELQLETAKKLAEAWPGDDAEWRAWEGKVRFMKTGHADWIGYATKYIDQATGCTDSARHYGHKRGDKAAIIEAVRKLHEGALFVLGKSCGEPLFQSVPNPRKVALSHYMAKHYKDVVDLVIVDEIHRCQDKDSAEAAAIEQWRGTRMVGLTGSLSNGYVLSTFFILHMLSPSFRREFGRDDEMGCVRRHGYLTQSVEYRDRRTREIVAFGSQSDRVERKTKILGGAPGMMPSLMRHILPTSTFIHLDDLELDLPPITEDVIWIDPGPTLGKAVREARKELLRQIRRDKHTMRQGALFGAMAGEWASADLANIGNEPDGVYRMRYPKSFGGEVVAEVHVPGLLPKEEQLLQEVATELRDGNNAIISIWHSQSSPICTRLKKLIEKEIGEECVILDSGKVKANHRDEWIEKEIVRKKRRLMLANPAAIGTGFNCLVHFCSMLFYQPPSYNPKDVRQVIGRVRRPRQVRPQRVKWLLYRGTSQENVHTLLGWKRAASVALEGLDDTAELESIGVDTSHEVTAYHMGQELYRMAARQEGELVDVE